MADNERFARALQTVFRGLHRQSRERARNGEITPQQAEALQAIAERGAVSTTALAVLLGIDPSTASRNLAGLERDGFIARKKASGDGRQTDVRLTARGKRVAETVGSTASQAHVALYDRLARADRARVVEALETLAALLEG
jgi:DNA-binding MarR family transcriptional regulator